MVTTHRTRLSRAGARQRRCFSLRSGARSVVDRAGRSQATGLPSSRCPGVRGHTWSRSARLAGRSHARGLPSSRCPGVRGHNWSRSARLAGRSQARGLPSSRCPSVRGHTWSRSARLAGAHPIAAHSGVSNCGFQGKGWSRQPDGAVHTPSVRLRKGQPRRGRPTRWPTANQSRTWRANR